MITKVPIFNTGLLTQACDHHWDGYTKADVTVQTRWGTDRRDLGRVGIRPSARYICTKVTKRAHVITTAYQRLMMLP